MHEVQTPDAANDPRYFCASSVLDIMHRTFLLFPVREIPAALSHVCVPVRRSCIVVDVQTRTSLLSSSSVEASELLSSMMPKTSCEPRFTWKAKASRLVTLLKRDHATTVIWDHASDTCFAAAPCASLGPGCPVGTALLGQVVLDMVAEPSSSTNPGAPATIQWIPNILVFDIIQLGDACNFSRARCPAMERYSVLLNLNHPSKGVFTSQHLKVQWAGKLHSLIEFDAEHRDAMPHIMEDYIRLGDEDPFEILFLRTATSQCRASLTQN